MIFVRNMFLIELALIVIGFAPFMIGVHKEKDWLALIGVGLEFTAGCCGFIAICALICQFFTWIF